MDLIFVGMLLVWLVGGLIVAFMYLLGDLQVAFHKRFVFFLLCGPLAWAVGMFYLLALWASLGGDDDDS